MRRCTVLNYIVMCHITTTSQSTTDRLYDSGPILTSSAEPLIIGNGARCVCAHVHEQLAIRLPVHVLEEEKL